MPLGDDKVYRGMTAQRPVLRPDLVAATSVLRGSSVGELCLDVPSTAYAAFSVSKYVLPSLARFCHSRQEPFFARGLGPKHGCAQSDERQVQLDGGTDRNLWLLSM